jgi:hypothetical protein
MPFDGRPISDPTDAEFSLTLVPPGRCKSTGVTLPDIVSLLEEAGVALCINDVKSAEVEARIGPLVKNSGRTFSVVDDFGELADRKRHGVTFDPIGDPDRDEPDGGHS